MPPNNGQHKPQDQETRLAIVEKELGTVFGIFQRIDTSMEKLVEVSSSLKELLAVHDNRLMEREKADLTIFEMIEKRKEEYSRGIERAHQKMEDMVLDFRKQIREEISEYGVELKESLRDLQQSQKELLSNLKTENKEQLKLIEDKLKDGNKEFDGELKAMDDRIAKLEKWRWFMLGGGAVIGFLLSKADWIATLFVHTGT